MLSGQPEVYIVDDDEAVRKSLCWLIESADHATLAFASAEALLEDFEPESPCCLITDVRMPGMGGLNLLSKILLQNDLVPVVVITAHGDIAMAVDAMKKGAFDFVEKPFDETALLTVVDRALAESTARHEALARDSDLLACLERLTPRERQVMELIVAGSPNRAVAEDLKISEKTVEAHRARIMEKMQAVSFADLVARVVEGRLSQSD
jgi:RNA polymerase sigma factor (sigma-70 family)